MFRTTLVLLALLPLSGCKKSEPPARDAHGFQQASTGEYQATGAEAGTGQTSPAAGPGETPPGQAPQLGAILSDPSTLQSILSGALAGGAASVGGVTGGQLGAVQSGIQMEAEKDAAGKKPVGELMSANLQQDGHAQAPFTLEPNHCYTIVGFGGFGVFKYQINVLTAPPAPPQVLAQSTADSGTPTVGPGEECIRNPTSAPMKVTIDLHVLQGQGTVGAQIYRK